MRVIRPAASAAGERRRGVLMAVAMLAIALVAAGLVLLGPVPSARAAAVAGFGAALGLGVGGAWLARALRRDPASVDASDLERLLAAVFDDSYALVVRPRLPGVSRDLAAILVGPAGVRGLIARRWRGRYRVRGKGWQYDTRGRQGFIACRTNPSFDAAAIRDGLSRWAESADLGQLPIESAIVFPSTHSRLILEEPADEIVTTDNTPWWAHRIGRTQRLDAARSARFVEAVLAAADGPAGGSSALRPVAR
jgi:hypothetical protein